MLKLRNTRPRFSSRSTSPSLPAYGPLTTRHRRPWNEIGGGIFTLDNRMYDFREFIGELVLIGDMHEAEDVPLAQLEQFIAAERQDRHAEKCIREK